ncbi:MAG: alpha/beta fold hydrolase [Vicinamibacteria bacterium]
MDERIEVSGRPVSLSLHGRGDTVVVLGHGAGSSRRQPFLLRLAEALAASGRAAVLHNFPYSEAGRRLPDPRELLEASSAAALNWAREALAARRVVGGGRSMGGRMASQAVARGLARADALVFLGYPLHPPGEPQRLRDAHLYGLELPLLFVQGTRDAFAREELLSPVIERLGARATLVSIEDGDHSFGVRRRVVGRSAAEVEQQVCERVTSWLAALGL